MFCGIIVSKCNFFRLKVLAGSGNQNGRIDEDGSKEVILKQIWNQIKCEFSGL